MTQPPLPDGESTAGAAYAWAALGGAPEALAHLSPVVRDDTLAARLPVRALARACVGACALAAAELAALRTGGPVPHARVDDGAVAAAFTSERQLLVDGRAPVTFAPLSRFWRTADGWVRTHANYPHHRERLLAGLGVTACTADADSEATVHAVAARLAALPAVEAEAAVYAAGGLAVALRTPREWAAHPQAAAVARLPLVARERLGGGAPRTLPPPAAGPLLPAAGVRVLDLTRVIAGPVATRTLALLGADVLRVDPPHRPELPDQHADTGFGKRSTALDLGGRAGLRTFQDLLAGADVVVTGYRPGALDRFGLSPDALAERRPGLVVAQLSAWGTGGPWAHRRGFDSLVQVATGIAATEGSPERPGALPAQALDHGTGYLLAAAVLRALTEQRTDGAGGTHLARLALARTAAWLTGAVDGEGAPEDAPGLASGPASGLASGEGSAADAPAGSPDRTHAYDPTDRLAHTDSPLGRLRYARSPVAFTGGPVNWSCPPGPWGADAPVWR
ncbi:CoA transferase [Streptomyces sp. MNP-20]|uniref:CoA transferase n=1 Tax=Streptomyces sp. MNP-20 TaxID=2721165 RepID=UPI001557FFD1|nr:CoA transferase [Streptomyces sp. MNP-20]